MKNAYYRITLDVHDVCSQVTLMARRGETGRIILATLTENGRPYEIRPECSAEFVCRRQDGIKVSNPCIIKDNTIMYTLSERTVIHTGVLECEFRLTDASRKLLVSPRFRLEVHSTIMNAGDAVESEVISANTVKSANPGYGEVFMWSDGNPDAEDRVGYFVSEDVERSAAMVKKCNSTSNIRGVSMAAPGFASNAPGDRFDENSFLRTQFCYVGLLGFAPVIDNGTCAVNDRCRPGDDGTAVPDESGGGYMVVERLDEKHVLILLEQSSDMVLRVGRKITHQLSKIEKTFMGTIGTAWTGTEAPYTQTIAVDGIMEKDEPFVELVGADGVMPTEEEEHEFAAIGNVKAHDGIIIVYAQKKTTMNLAIKMKVYRFGEASGGSGEDGGEDDSCTGEDGGYYSPIVTQQERGRMRFEFAPSKTGMPELPNVDVDLPEGPEGKPGENGTATDEQVNQWLTDHPEATTTVQDGAVTGPKLADGAVSPAKTKGFLEWDRYVPEGTQEIEQEVPDYSNLFPACGYALDKYISGSETQVDFVKDGAGKLYIKRIPVAVGDVIRIKTSTDILNVPSGDTRFRITNSELTKTSTLQSTSADFPKYGVAESGNVVKFTTNVLYGTVPAYLEISFPRPADYMDIIITKNQEIKTRTEIEVIEVEAHYEGLRLKPEVAIQGFVGGRNYAKDFPNPFIKSSGFGGANNKTPICNVPVPAGAKAGDYVTISFDYKATNIVADAGKEPTWMIEGDGDVNGWGESRYPHNGNLPINQSGHWSYSTKLLPKAAENNYWKCEIRCDNIASGYIEISNYKIEKGMCETDWTAPPEVVEKRILALETADFNADNIPAYAVDEFNTTIHTLQSLVKPNAFSFGFISDLHFSSDNSEYCEDQLRPPAIHATRALRKLSKQFPLTCVCFGGDTMANGTSTGGYNDKQHGLDNLMEVNEWLSDMGAPTIALGGNHEWVFDGQDQTVSLTDDEIYKLFVCKYPYLYPAIKEANRHVFYMIDEANEVVMVYINTPLYQSELSDVTRAGIDKVAALNTNNYPWVVCRHVGIYGGVMADAKATIDYIKGKDQNIICVVAGHAHADWKLDYNGVSVISNVGAGFWATRENQDGTTYERKLGTASETAFTIVTIDKDAKKIHLTRYGTGVDREYSY